MKRKILALVCIFLLSSCFLLGCDKNTGRIEGEEGYFKYSVSKASGAVRIEGLTDEGKEQEVLTVPTRIGGKAVYSLGYSTGYWADITGGYIISDKLKMLYIPHEIDPSEYVFRGNSCPALEAVFICANMGGNFSNFSDSHAIIYRSRFRSANTANVSYMYNYTNAPNEGYYWIDNVPYGEKVEYIPAAPERNGYMFQYWYYVEDGQNIKWDFDVNTTPEAIYEEEEGADGEEKKVVYQETVLYAMWE